MPISAANYFIMMDFKFFPTVLLIASFLTFSVAGLETQIQSEEIIGCYSESEESRLFLSSAGDYNPSNISPIKCVTQCGIKFKYAALQNGNLCFCANSLPTSAKLSDTECNIPCPGSSGWPESAKSLRCGGPMKNSIYTARERILGFSLHPVSTLPILERVTIYGNLTNGRNVTFSYDLGDGTLTSQSSHQPRVDHIYDLPGSYVVTFTGSNLISGSVSTSSVYNVDDPLSGVELSCPRSAMVGQLVECNGTLTRGSRVNATFVFSNGFKERLSISSQYYSTGEVVPRTNNTMLSTPLSVTGSLVIPGFEFQHSGRVTHWDFEAIKFGFVKLKIFRPVCSSGQVYCVSNKSCLSSSSPCISIHQRRCADSETFCIFRKRCLPNTQASRRSCTPNSAYNFNTPPVDYKLIFQYRTEIKEIGHHIVTLPPSDQPEVQEGDVIGLGSESGQLAYKNVPAEEGGAFIYSTSVSLEGDTLLRSSLPSVLQKHFIIAAHITHATSFVISNTFSTVGIQSVSSNITGVTLITIDHPIANVSLEYRNIVNTNDSFVFSVPQHTGSNVTYNWDFGNGIQRQTQFRSITYKFHSEGVFLVRLTAENSVGSMTVSGLIRVYDRITSFKFSKCPIQAKASGQPTVIEWEAARGTNITYIVDFGDASSRYEVVTTGVGSRRGQTTHQYSSIGNYTVSVHAFNVVGPNISISCYAMVEIPLAGLELSIPLDHVTSNIYLAVGDYMVITRHLKEGTHFKCSFDFQDGSPALVTDQVNATHKYGNPGKYQVHIVCYNDVSSINKTLNALVIVEELKALSGLTVAGAATQLGTASSLTIQMKEGTTYFCTWDFGDGSVSRTDASHTGQPMTHAYQAINTYKVVVSCNNRLGTISTEADIAVDTTVETVSIVTSQRYIRVYEEISFNVEVLKGSRLYYRVEYGDGKNRSLQRNGRGQSLAGRETFTHAYTTDGSFTVTVTVSNSLGAVVQALDYSIVVEHPVQDLILQSSSPVSLDPGIAFFYLSVISNVSAPTSGQCVWMFNDGSPASSPEPLQFKPLSRSHTFTKEGSYVTRVNISNHVSSVAMETIVRVQKLKAVTILPQRLVNGVLELGLGPGNMYFPVNETVVLSALSQEGDISYSWEFGDGSSLNKSTVPTTNHTFTTPSSCRVKVQVDNVLDILKSNQDIFIQNPVGNAAFTSTFPAYYTDPTNFYLTVASRGSDSCLLLSLGDNQGVRLGGESCRPRVFLPNETFIKIPADQHSYNYTHVYAKRGNYTAVFSVRNHVSLSKVTSLVSIQDFPCLQPEVKIDSTGTRSNPRKIKKSEPLVLGVDLKYRCPVASKIVFTWRAYEVTLANPDDTSKPVQLPSEQDKMFNLPAKVNLMDVGALKIRERFFPFMTLKFSLKVSFIGRDRDVSHMSSTHSVWIDIERSELSVVIKGGQRRSLGYGLDMTLDGSESKDPDIPSDKTGITYSWSCRKKGEEFPSEFDPPKPTGGCWGNGVYTLNSTQDKVKLNTGDFIQNEVYVFRLICTKDSRSSSFEQEVTILPGQPPTMSLRCNFNCLKKMNPLERLVLETLCVDCKPNDKLGYEWSLFRLDLGKDKNTMDSWVKQTNWAAYTSTGTDKGNLVIKPQVLTAGREYFLRLNAWKPGGYPGGFVEYQFIVNVGPTGGSCVVNPLEGFALETDFKMQCDNWHDTDTPLQYMIELANGDHIVPVFTGFESVTSAVFPLGKQENNFTIDVRIKVLDKYFLATSTKFSIRVTEPIKVDYDEVGGSVADAVGSGNPQEATQMTNAVSSVLNSKAENSDASDASAQEERANFRGQIAKSLTNMSADSFDGVAQKGEALNALTQATDEVKEDAQEASIKAMDDMGSYLSSADSSRNLDTTAKSLFSGIGNMVGASSKTAKKVQNSTGADSGKSTNNTKKALDVVDKVSGALMKQLVAGDKPKAIKTGNMDLAIGRKNLEDLGADDDDDDENEGDTGGFRLPDPAALFGGANTTTEEGATSGIGSTMTAMGENPFPNENANDLNSKTIGLALTDGNGKPLDLAGQTLEMYVPRDLKKNPLKPLELNHFAADDPPMRVHKFNRTTNDSAIVVEIQTFDPKIKFAIRVRFEKRPSAMHFDFNHTFPSQEEAAKMRRRPHPFTYVINHVRIKEKLLAMVNGSVLHNGTTGSFFLGIKAVNLEELGSVNDSYSMRIYLPACKSFDDETNQWVTNGCVVGNKTRANITHCVCMPGVEDDEDMDPTASPIFDSPTSDSSGQGSQAAVRGKRFVRKKVSKLSLASSFFPAPNPIDFNKVFNVNILENPISLVTVLTIFLVYVILAVYARREDKKDVERAGVTPLEDNDSLDRHHYEITVYTGYGKKAGTTSQVSFTLTGDEGETEPRILKDAKRKTFQRRGVDVFLATFPESLGELNYLHIWHDNSGRSPSWYLSRVIIEDLNNDKKFLFINESWLAVEKGDGTVDRLIAVAGQDEITSFNHLFYSTTQTKLADGHLWFSIFMRPAKSRFTRLQRLSCCLTLLYCSMLANAMFYNIGGESDPSSTIHLGPLSFSPAQVGIGIMSSLVVVPANIFIVTVFRGVEAKPTSSEMKERKTRKHWWLYELFFCFFDRKKPKNDFINILHKNYSPDDQFLDVSSNSRTDLTVPQGQSMGDLSNSSRVNLTELEDKEMVDLGLGDDDIFFKISKQEKREEMAKKMKKKKKKKKKMFPYWFLYVGWAVCGMTCFVCAFFIVLYGLQFGKEKSAQWLSSMLVSFFQDVLISQPIKVVAIALVMAAIIKKPPEEDDDDDDDKKKLEDEQFLHEPDGFVKLDKRMKPKTMIRLKPPDKEKLKEAREQRFKEMKMNAAIKEVVLYVFFVACLCIVSYSHRDPTSFHFRDSMYNTFIEGKYGGIRGFSSISSRENFYEWAKTTLINGLFKTAEYNDAPTEPGFTQDGFAYVVGGARMRQLRVENGSCQVPVEFRHLIKPCTDWYGYFSEDTGQYDVAWEPLKNESLYRPPFTFESWEFNDSTQLDGMPIMAYVSTYGGGGFAAELGETKEHASQVIKALENFTWIDSRTRAVITELSTYNAVSNLFCIMTLVVEFLPTNGIFLFTNLKISRLFSTGGGMATFVVVCEFFILIFFAVFIYQECKQLYQMRKRYFKEFWNCIEFTMVILVLVCVSMFLMRIKLVESAITKLENNPGKFVSFERVASWSEAFMIMVALLVFITWLKGMKLLRFNPRIQVLAQTLKGSAAPLATFSVVFLVFFMAYALFAFAVFSKDLASYYNFVTTSESVMGLLLGAFDYGEIETAQPIIGPIFFFTFMVFGNFIIMNMFLTIIMDVFAEVKEQVGSSDTEFEVVEYMIKRFRRVTGVMPNKINVDDPVEKKGIEDKFREDMRGFKKKRSKRHAKTTPMAESEITKRFSRLDDSLKGFYCQDFAEERMLDDIVEKKWGVTMQHSYADSAMNLKIEEERETMRNDMFAAVDNFEISYDEGSFNLAFEEDESFPKSP